MLPAECLFLTTTLAFVVSKMNLQSVVIFWEKVFGLTPRSLRVQHNSITVAPS